jgi:hypothetical protein
MLEHGGIAGHQAGSREAENLPEWKVPWHHGEHDADRIEGHEARTRFGCDRFARQKARGIVGIEVAGQRAFLRLGDAVAQRLSHLLCHQAPIPGGVVAQRLRRLTHRYRAIFEAGLPPLEERIMHLADHALHLMRLPFLIACDRLAIGWVDRLECHGRHASCAAPQSSSSAGGIASSRSTSVAGSNGRGTFCLSSIWMQITLSPTMALTTMGGPPDLRTTLSPGRNSLIFLLLRTLCPAAIGTIVG